MMTSTIAGTPSTHAKRYLPTLIPQRVKCGQHPRCITRRVSVHHGNCCKTEGCCAVPEKRTSAQIAISVAALVVMVRDWIRQVGLVAHPAFPVRHAKSLCRVAIPVVLGD